ncbi:MAG: hypothetical protein KIS96_12830 [Bauldia sp.]|nr:hypothetical protein [Bauldia sp.]
MSRLTYRIGRTVGLIAFLIAAASVPSHAQPNPVPDPDEPVVEEPPPAEEPAPAEDDPAVPEPDDEGARVPAAGGAADDPAEDDAAPAPVVEEDEAPAIVEDEPAPPVEDDAAAPSDDGDNFGRKVIDADGERVFEAGGSLVITGEADGVAAFGGSVTLDADVDGNVTILGAAVSIAGAIDDSLWVGASEIRLTGTVGRNAWLAAGSIEADVAVTGNFRGAAGTIAIGPNSSVGGALSLAAAEIAIEGGTYGGAVTLIGDIVRFNGQTEGDLRVGADTFVIGPDAVIGGNVVLYDNTEATVENGAVIEGDMVEEGWWSWFYGPRLAPWPGQIGFALFAAGTAIVAGLALLLFAGGTFTEAARDFRFRPMSSIVIGIVFVIVLPLLVALFAVTVVGLPIAVAALLFLPLAVLLGHTVASLGVANMVFNWTGTALSPWLSVPLLVVGALALGAITLIPYAGGILVGIATLVGMGAFVRGLSRRLRRRLPATA